MPGERYFSALIESTEEIAREDFCESEWNGPPEGCIGWWQSRIPVLEKGKIYWAPTRVLVAYFESLLNLPNNEASAYVMALLLMRKRIVQWKDTVERNNSEWMQLRLASEKKTFEVKVLELQPDEIQAIQNELAEQLFTDHQEEDLPSDSAQTNAEEA